RIVLRARVLPDDEEGGHLPVLTAKEPPLVRGEPLLEFGRAVEGEKSPLSRIAVAASTRALIAIQVRRPPVLIRRAPAAAISCSERPGRARTLTGLVRASQTVRISSVVVRPGA